MDNSYFFKLVGKHVKGECSEQEIKLLVTYYDVLSSQHKAALSDEQIRHIEKLIWSRIASNMNAKGRKQPRYRLLLYPVAAAIVMVLFFGFFFFFRGDSDTMVLSQPNDVLTPGSNKATLITANGNVVTLDGEKGSITSSESGIRYTDGSTIALLGASSQRTARLSDSTPGLDGMHTVVTPRGGQYVVVLPDASKVWLNAHSSLKYPSRFDNDERKVFLEGEAYFEVVHQRKASKSAVPFKVVTTNQIIEVLGTEFNVAAYPEGLHEKTTLVSGAVKVSTPHQGDGASGILKPGEQCLISSSGIDIHPVDISSAIAWKSGRFSFDDKPFAEIMAELGRWYNFTVDYEGPIPSAQFVGGAFRTDSISSVLHFLKSAHLVYRIESVRDGAYQLTIKTRKEER